MHIKSISLTNFKRFTDLRIGELPSTARLVMLVGPNGTGKSSLFDAFRTWHSHKGGLGVGGFNENYHVKTGYPSKGGNSTDVTFHEPLPPESERKKLFYIRSAYRHSPDFTASGLRRAAPVLEDIGGFRMIDQDERVAANYQRMLIGAIDDLLGGRVDAKLGSEIREMYLGRLKESMERVFGDLQLIGTGMTLEEGSFYFTKGAAERFHYRNLSGGEKAAFDLLLDLMVRSSAYDDAIYCIDEPELHLNSRVQGLILEEMLRLIPKGCQLWLATHSIGMIRTARNLALKQPSEVVFLDFADANFDETTDLAPSAPNRDLWRRALSVALADLAGLVAPERVVLCEGAPSGSGSKNTEFDARCYRVIFSDTHPDTDFVSIGNASDVETDRLSVGDAIHTLTSATERLRLIDRDDLSTAEVDTKRRLGVQVLSRRHIESYLWDDEIIARYCESIGKADSIDSVLQAKTHAISDSVNRGNPADDMKSATPTLYSSMRDILGLTGTGSTAAAFSLTALAPQVVPGTRSYAELEQSVFGETSVALEVAVSDGLK